MRKKIRKRDRNKFHWRKRERESVCMRQKQVLQDKGERESQRGKSERQMCV